MTNAMPALIFLREDRKNVIKQQWLPGGKPFQSLLQRNEKGLDELLELFDPKPDEAEWLSEYNNEGKSNKLSQYRKSIAFLKASRKEFHEEYDPDITDVDYMRLLETPYTDSQYVIDWSIKELGN